MKKLLPVLFVFLSTPLFSQKADSIAFHLYTDSLKKGVHNYINVDGKVSSGNWRPLTSKEITFSASAGMFDGNDLIIPADYKKDSVEIKATLKSNPAVSISTTIWIKKKPDPDKLPTVDEIFNKTKAKDSAERKSKNKNVP